MTCVYIGQTVHLQVQKRFESHAKVVRLLAKYVNSSDTRVMFRLCSQFKILYGTRLCGIEHLPPDQAALVVDDIEARLIYEKQPSLNAQRRHIPKAPWKPFVIEDVLLR